MILPFWKITILYFSRNRNDRNRTKQNDVCLHLTFGFAGRYDTHIYKYLHLFPPLNKIAHGNYLFLLWSSQTILINQTLERNSFTLKFEITHFFHIANVHICINLTNFLQKIFKSHKDNKNNAWSLQQKKLSSHLRQQRTLCLVLCLHKAFICHTIGAFPAIRQR